MDDMETKTGLITCKFNERIVKADPHVDPIQLNYIKSLLPHWKTEILNYSTKNDILKTTIIIEASSEEKIRQWVSEFEERNKFSYSIRSTEKCTGRYVCFKQRLKCRHRTVCKRKYNAVLKNRTRNTNCPSGMTITLNAVKDIYRGKDKDNAPNKEMPCKIVLVATHNHSLENDAFPCQYRTVGQGVRSTLLNLYSRGHSPATALEILKLDICLKHENYEAVLLDRKYCPDYMYCYHLYRKAFQKNFKSQDLDFKRDQFLKERLDWFNSEVQDQNSAKMVSTEAGYVICICPPLFRRVHKQIEAASQTVLIDSCAKIALDGGRLFILLTPSECGGLPLGVIITSSVNPEIISKGFQILKEMGGADMFGGCSEGPKAFLTDDCSAQRKALRYIFPQSETLWSMSNVFQSVWKWLTSCKNDIPLNKQDEFFQQFRSMVFAQTEEGCFEKYNEAKSNAENCPNYVKILIKYWGRKEEWATYYRNSLLSTRNNYYSETAMQLIKKKIFEKVNAFNMIQMVDFILTKFMFFYQKRLLDAASNALHRNILNKPERTPPEEYLNRVLIVSEDTFIVPSETNENLRYILNTDTLTCTCFEGLTGNLCKHVDWICCLVSVEQYSKKIDDENMQKVFYTIATGFEASEDFSKSLEEFQTTLKNEFSNNNEEDCEYIRIVHEDSGEIKSDGEILERGQENLENITEMLTAALEESPSEMCGSLELMKNKLLKLKTVNEIVEATAAFGSGFHKEEISNRVAKESTAKRKRKQ